ncbi:hypothetical protein GCM10023318_49920 [Nocardia callitridis]|uniref:Uncharacterized protein n=1 Tax=Nocardia callitridis TaxID=648753 RepID=A0ABP9KW24_9NOCA
MLVTVATPRLDPLGLDLGYLCHVDIEGMAPAPIRLQSNASTPGRALALVLRKVTDKLGIEMSDFLSDALVGITHPRQQRRSARASVSRNVTMNHRSAPVELR